MGGKTSKYSRIYNENKDIKRFKSHYDLIGLKESDVGLLYESFLEIDFDNSGSIYLNELLSFISSEETSFIKKIFSAFDTDDNKSLDFHEFVISIWNYCTLNPKNLAAYSFSLFDVDDSGVLDKNEIHKMLLQIYGKRYEDSVHAKRLFLKFQELKIQFIDEEFFIEFACTHPAMLYPATVFQNILKAKIIGEKFWVEQMNWRDVTFKKYRPITFIINFNDMMNEGDQFKKIDMSHAGTPAGTLDQRAPPPSKPTPEMEKLNIIDIDDHHEGQTHRHSTRRGSKRRKKSVDESLNSDRELLSVRSDPPPNNRRKSLPDASGKEHDDQALTPPNGVSSKQHSPSGQISARADHITEVTPMSTKNRGTMIMTLDSVDSKGASVKSRNEKSFFPTSLKITEESKKKDKLFGKPKETPFKKFLFGTPKVIPSFSEEDNPDPPPAASIKPSWSKKFKLKSKAVHVTPKN